MPRSRSRSSGTSFAIIENGTDVGVLIWFRKFDEAFVSVSRPFRNRSLFPQGFVAKPRKSTPVGSVRKYEALLLLGSHADSVVQRHTHELTPELRYEPRFSSCKRRLFLLLLLYEFH